MLWNINHIPHSGAQTAAAIRTISITPLLPIHYPNKRKIRKKGNQEKGEENKSIKSRRLESWEKVKWRWTEFAHICLQIILQRIGQDLVSANYAAVFAAASDVNPSQSKPILVIFQ